MISLTGESYLALRKELLSFMKKERIPIGFTGPSGTGKTVLAIDLASLYGKELGVKSIYLQLNPEMTRTMAIGGETLEKGSVVVKKKYIAEACINGYPIVVDEAGHTTEQMLLQFNSLVAEPYSFELAGEVYEVNPRTRFIFCFNPANTHLGNISVPQSLAARIRFIEIGYPSIEEEIEIVKKLAPTFSNTSVIKYLVSFCSKVRNDYYPITSRNISMILKSLNNLESKSAIVPEDLFIAINERCTSEFGMSNGEFNDFISYLSVIGADNFRRVIKECFMVYAPLPSIVKDVYFIKQRIESTCL